MINPDIMPAIMMFFPAIFAGAKEVDGGPIIIQARVPVEPEDTPECLAARVLQQEHRIYPQAIKWFAQRRLSIRSGEVLLDAARSPLQGLADSAD